MPVRFAAQVPGAPALRDRGRTLNYGELRGAVAAEVDWLRARGGERHGLLADNGCGWVVADLALQEAALLNVPLPPFFTDAQLAHAIADAGIDSILADEGMRGRAERASFHPVAVSPHSGLTLWKRTQPGHGKPLLPTGTVKVTYTSGSTGAPRGICLDAASLGAVAESVATAAGSLRIERHLCLLPLATLLENVAGVYAALRMGAACDLPPASATGVRFGGIDADALLACIAERAPQSLILVPELLRVLVAAVERGWAVPDSLRFIAVGGAVVSVELLARAAACGLPVHEGYGLSECASVVTLNTPAASRRGSVGRPLPHARVRIDDAGEIHVAGAVMLGRLGDDGPRPAEIATGDLGDLDADGYLYIRGRRRNVIITALGRNVSPEWIEGELTQEAGIAHACVVGEARPFVVALVSPLSPSVPRAVIERAVAAANRRLPDYARVRRFAVVRGFSPADGTLTANGRLRREIICEHHAATIGSLYQPIPATVATKDPEVLVP